MHPLGGGFVPSVHLVAVAQLPITPPQLLPTDAGEELETGPVTELDELSAARHALVHVDGLKAEAVGQQRQTQRYRVAMKPRHARPIGPSRRHGFARP